MSQKTQTIKSLKLDEWFAGELGKSGSEPDDFWWSFTLHFVLEKLAATSRETFLDLLENAGGEAALEYAVGQIPDFESKLSEALSQLLAKLKNQVIRENMESGGPTC